MENKTNEVFMKPFHLTEDYILIHFDSQTQFNIDTIISSEAFENFFLHTFSRIQHENPYLIQSLHASDPKTILELLHTLIVHPSNHTMIEPDKQTSLIQLIETMYDIWRHYKRFGWMENPSEGDPTAVLIEKSEQLNAAILTLYRTLYYKVSNKHFHILRQLPAGVNASIMYQKMHLFHDLEDTFLNDLPVVTHTWMRPPFIIQSKSHTRTGLFEPIQPFSLNSLSIHEKHYVMFPIYVGTKIAFVYIHRDFLHQGMGLTNLFEFVKLHPDEPITPDLMMFYGIKEHEYDGKFFYDEEKTRYVGLVSRHDKNDYFGYLKKMLLTLFNTASIHERKLPIHGAMVSILLKDNRTHNIVIIGDSGAGKSETLEAFRMLASDDILNMTTVFDDMGTFFIQNNTLYANGSEIGAFVRLDDLEAGYAYHEIDRAIFLNPHKKNARLIMPISSYSSIIQPYQVDVVLYANNYEQSLNGLKLFSHLNDALKVFKEGKRFAKGTTSEVGLVETYFANPFGPVQFKDQVEPLLEAFMSHMITQNIKVGELYTKLSIDGYEMKGPLEAAHAILQLIKKAQ